MKVSIIGAGHMGSAMAARLSDTGHDVTIWDRNRDHSSHLTIAGIAVAGDAASRSPTRQWSSRW